MPRVIDARRPKGHQRLFVRYIPTRTINGCDLGDSDAIAYEIQTRPVSSPSADWTRAGWACNHPQQSGRNWVGTDTGGGWTRWRSTRTEIAEDLLDTR